MSRALRRGAGVLIALCAVTVGGLLSATPGHAAAGGTLIWRGGAVQHHPVVYLTFWGPDWNTSSASMRDQMKTLVGTDLPGNTYANVLLQYSDQTGYVHNDTKLGGVFVDTDPPPAGITDSMIDGELAHAQSVNGWDNSPDSQFFLLPQRGTVYAHQDDFCGWHGTSARTGTVAPGDGNPFVDVLITYAGDPAWPPCSGAPETFMTAVATHEWAESATDPLPEQGWTADSSTTGAAGVHDEVGDLCVNAQLGSFTDGIEAQPLWDNRSSQCTLDAGAVAPGGPSETPAPQESETPLPTRIASPPPTEIPTQSSIAGPGGVQTPVGAGGGPFLPPTGGGDAQRATAISLCVVFLFGAMGCAIVAIVKLTRQPARLGPPPTRWQAGPAGPMTGMVPAMQPVFHPIVHYSPDGRWWWNGHQWLPTQPQ